MSFGSTVTNNWNNTGQFLNYASAATSVQSNTAGSRCKILFMGDSTTQGLNAATNGWRLLSPSFDVTANLATYGLAIQNDNFDGGGTSGANTADTRVALGGTGPAYYDTGAICAGGFVIATQNAGDTIVFTLPTAHTYDRLDYTYIDVGGGETMDISLDGGGTISGSPFTLTGTNSFNTYGATVNITAASHSSVTLTQHGSGALYIQGVAFWNSTTPKFEVYNSGVPGAVSGMVNGGTTTGVGQYQGGYLLAPQLCIIDFGINDIAGGVSTATIVTNLGYIVSGLRGINCDCIIMIPEPGTYANYGSGMPALQTALYSYSNSNNVPVIDLSATYNNDATAYNTAGFLSGDGIHPTAAGYADIASRVSVLLEGITPGAGPSPPAAINSILVLP